MHRRLLVLLVFIAALALHLPSLWMGFYADDYLHQIVLDGTIEGLGMSPLSLFDFGTLDDWRGLEGGVGEFPWWTSPDWSARFFRPLTSLTLWVDHALFGRDALGYHFTSLVWYAGLLALVWALYRELALTRGTASLAFGFFAVTNGGMIPVGWIANRNSLIETTFTVAAVLAALRGARGHRTGPLMLAFACAACGTLAKESGVIAFPLIAATLWRASRAEGPGADRLHLARWSVLAAVVPVFYLVALAASGFGTNSLFYATPWMEPLVYARNLALLATAGLLRLLAPFPLDLVGWRPALAVPATVVTGLLVAGPLLLIWRRRRGLHQPRFLAFWIALALAVQGAPPASDRLLLTAAVASSPLLASFVVHVWREGGRLERVMARGLVAVSLILAGLLVPAQGVAFVKIARDTRAEVLATDVGDKSLGHRDLVVLQAANGMVPFVIATTWGVERPDDRELAFWPLQTGRRGLEWTREDERTLLIRSLDMPFLDLMFERVYRTPEDVVQVGRRWSSPLFEVEAVEVEDEDGALRCVRVRFERDLDDPALRFLATRDGRLTAIDVPAVGQTEVLDQLESTTPFMP